MSIDRARVTRLPLPVKETMLDPHLLAILSSIVDILDSLERGGPEHEDAVAKARALLAAPKPSALAFGSGSVSV